MIYRKSTVYYRTCQAKSLKPARLMLKQPFGQLRSVRSRACRLPALIVLLLSYHFLELFHELCFVVSTGVVRRVRDDDTSRTPGTPRKLIDPTL